MIRGYLAKGVLVPAYSSDDRPQDLTELDQTQGLRLVYCPCGAEGARGFEGQAVAMQA